MVTVPPWLIMVYPMRRVAHQIKLRVPPEMKDWIERQAGRNGASLNSEIIRCIRERMDRLVNDTTENKTAVEPQA